MDSEISKCSSFAWDWVSCVEQFLTHYVLSTCVFAIDTDPRKCLISISFIMHSSDIKTFEEYAPQVLAEVPGGGPTEERSCSSEYFSCVSTLSKPPPPDTQGKVWTKVGSELVQEMSSDDQPSPYLIHFPWIAHFLEIFHKHLHFPPLTRLSTIHTVIISLSPKTLD